MPTHDTAWISALMLAPAKIGGVSVRPFSAWHAHAMQITGMRFALDANGRGPTPGELANAIAICRSRWSMRQIGVPAAPGWLIVWLKARWALVDWRKDALALLRHASRYRQAPEMDAPPKGVKFAEMGAPPHFSRAVDLIEKLPGISLEQAMNMPYVQLNCIRATLADLRGVRVCSWAALDGEKGQDLAAGLQKAEEAIKRAGLGSGRAA